MADMKMQVNVEPYIDLRKLQSQIDREKKNLKLHAELVITQSKHSQQKILKEIKNYYTQLEQYQAQYASSNSNFYNLELKKNKEFLDNYASLLQKQVELRNTLSDNSKVVYNKQSDTSMKSSSSSSATEQMSTGNPAAALLDSLQTTSSIVSQFNALLAELSVASSVATTNLNQLGTAGFQTTSQYGLAAREYLQIIQDIGNANGFAEQTEQISALSSASSLLIDFTKEYANAVLGKIATDEAAAETIATVSTITKAAGSLDNIVTSATTGANTLSSTVSATAGSISKTASSAVAGVATLTTATISSATAAGAATTATGLLSSSLQALKAAFISNPFGLILVTLTTTISIASTLLNNYKKQQEEISKNSKELTQSYLEDKKSLEDQSQLYSDLYKQLQNTNQSVEQSAAVKKQLLDLQTELNDSYGVESEQIDLINGKYQEQVDTLNTLSKDKAKAYVAENKQGYDQARDYLSEKKSYKITKFNGIDLNDEINEYLEDYAQNLFYREVGNRAGEWFHSGNTELTLYSVTADEGYKFLVDLYNDVSNKFGSSPEAETLKRSISKTLAEEFDTEQIEAWQKTIETYVESEIEANNTLGDLYNQSINAIDAYNLAIVNGDNLDASKKALDEIKDKVYQNTELVENSELFFDDLFNTISKGGSIADDTLNETTEKLVSFQDLLSDKQVEEEVNNLVNLAKIDLFTSEQIKSSEVLMNALANTSLSIEDVTNEINLMAQQTDESAEATQKAADTISKLSTTVKSATGYVNEFGQHADLTKLQNAADLAKASIDELTSILNIIDNGSIMSVDVIESISKKYPQLLSYIGDEKALRNELVKEISNQQFVADTYYTNIKEQDTNFYKSLLENNSNKVKQLKEYYGINLEDFKSLAEAKYKVDSTLLNNLSEKWANYYKAQNKANLIADIINDPTLQTDYGLDKQTDQEKKKLLTSAYEDEKKARAVAEEYANLYEMFKGLMDNDFSLNLDTIKLNGNKGINPTTDTPITKFSEQIDYAAERAKILEGAIDSLNNKIKNSTTYTDKSNLYNDIISKQSELLLFYNSSANKYSNDYEKALKNKNLTDDDADNIRNGSLNIEQFSGKGENSKDEKRYNAIQDAIRLRDLLSDANIQVDNSISSLRENAAELANIRWDKASSNIENINSDIAILNEKLNNTTNYKERNTLLDQILAKQKQSLNEQITAISGDEEEIASLYEKINKDYRVNSKSKSVSSGEKIATGGIIDPTQLSYIVTYNKLINAVAENTKELSVEQEKYNGYASETQSEIFANINAEIDKLIATQDNLMSEIDSGVGFMDDNSLAQIALFQAGYEQSAQKVAYIKQEIINLNKEYSKSKGNLNDYNERLDELNSQQLNAAQSMKKYQDDIVSAMKARYDEQQKLADTALKDELDRIKTAKDAALSALNDQLSKFKETIDARKKALQDEEDEDTYQQQLDEYIESISKLESRMNLLKQAEMSGDREAGAERRKLEEELSEERKNLDALQKSYGLDKAIEALDEEYDEYEKLNKQQIEDTENTYNIMLENAQKEYDIKKENMDKLFENEKALIIEAAQLTSSEFSKIFEEINKTLSNYGLSVSSDMLGALNSSNSNLTNDPSSGGSSSTSNKSAIITLLKSGTSKTGDSALNKYIGGKYGSYLTFGEMVELARFLGLTDINSESDVKGNSDNREKIRKALINASFETGGIAKMSSPSGIVRSLTNGKEDGLAFVQNGEGFVKPNDVSLMKQLMENLPAIHNLTTIFKDNVPSVSSIVKHTNYPSPIISFNLNGGTITKEAIPQFNDWKTDIVKEVSKVIMKGARTK